MNNGIWGPSASTIVLKSYAYDSNGNVTQETDGDNYSVRYGYTPSGKLEWKLDQVNYERSLPYSVKYKYDTLGRTAKEIYVKSDNSIVSTSSDPNEGMEVNYAYNLQPDTLTVTKSVTAYDNLTKYNGTNINGTVENKIYDLLGNVIEYDRYRDASTVDKTFYTYNVFNKVSKKTSNIIDMNDALTGTTTKTDVTISQYDKIGELYYTCDQRDTPTDTIDDIYGQYRCDARGLVTDYTKGKVGSADSITTHKTYDPNGNILTEIDGNNNTIIYTYDTANRQKTKDITVGGVLHESQQYYNADGNVVRKVDCIGSGKFNDTVYAYDPLDRLVSTSQGGVTVEMMEYNNRSLQNASYKVYQSQVGGSNTYVKTAYTYDHNGKLYQTTIDPAGLNRITSLGYDNHGNANARYDENNRKTTLQYDGLNRLVSVTNPKGEAVAYTYDYAGNMLSQGKTLKDTDNGTVQNITQLYEYNSLDKLIRKIDNNGRSGSPGSYTYTASKVETYNYYVDGTLKYKKDRNGATTFYAYNSQGWVTTTSGPAIKLIYSYDGNGNPTTVALSDIGATGTRSASSEAAVRAYDALNRVTTKSFKKDTDANPYLSISYTYDTITGGNLQETSSTSGFTTTKTYDSLQRLSTVNDGSSTITYSYYNNGSRQKTDYGNNTTEVYAYNTDNTLKTLTNSAINAVIGIYSYTYDKAGNQTSKIETTTDAGITTSYYYDELNRLKKVNENSKTTIYTYDALGNRKTETARTTSGTGKYYTYNDQNRLVSVTSSAITYLSDLTPSAITGVAPDKDKQTKGGTTNGAITISGVKYEKGLGVAASSTASDVTYTWTAGTQNYFSVDLGLDDNCSNSGSGVQFQIYLGTSTSAAIDTTVTAATGAKSILLNVSSVTSIRLKVTKTGTNTTEYPDWADAKLINLDGTSTTNPVNFAYDNNGNLTTQTIGTGIGNTVNSYYYDELNQQRYTIANIAGAFKKYENIYNGDGYRVRQTTTSGGITTSDVRYVYEYDKPVFELTSTASAITARNVYGLNLLKRTTSGQTYSYMYNGHADVVALLNSSGVAQTYQYDEWGNITNQTGSVNNNITYAGYQYDKDTKLYYLNSRMYDPLTARFLQEDTYSGDDSDPLTLNLYTYCHNSPVMYTDPTGHWELNDATLPVGAQAALASLTTAYFNTEDDTERSDIHKMAQTIRNNADAYNNSNITSTSSYGSDSFYSKTAETLNSGKSFTEDTWPAATDNDDNAPKNDGKGSTVLFQHGVNANITTFETMVNKLSNYSNAVNGGTLSLRKGERIVINTYNMYKKLENLGIGEDDLMGLSNKEKTYLLNTLNVNVLFRTEFSNPTGTHDEQINELGKFVNDVSYSFDKVSLVGHSKGGLVSVGYTAENPERVEKVITVDTPYEPNAYARISCDMMDAAYDRYRTASENYSTSSGWQRHSLKNTLDFAKELLDNAVKEGTRGSQTDYFKTGGLRDLAGYTSSLAKIRDVWNQRYLDGRLDSVQRIAFATDSYDGYAIFPKGDMVVSLESQRGQGFYGINAMTLTITGKDRNTMNYSHVGITDRDPMIRRVGAALGIK